MTTAEDWLDTIPVNGPGTHRSRNLQLGLRPASGHCPMRVVGKRCTAMRTDSCICLRHQHVLDHARCWRRGSELVLTSEPYDADGQEIAAYTEDLAALGLNLSISGISPWYPGHTVCLMVERD